MISERDVDSTAISDFTYDEDSRELFVRFRGDKAHVYYDVSLDDYLALRDTESKGKFVNKVIKRKYEFAPVD